MQGPHQVAQNSTTKTLPFSKPVMESPFTHFSTLNAGALSPTFRVSLFLSVFSVLVSGFAAGLAAGVSGCLSCASAVPLSMRMSAMEIPHLNMQCLLGVVLNLQGERRERNSR